MSQVFPANLSEVSSVGCRVKWWSGGEPPRNPGTIPRKNHKNPEGVALNPVPLGICTPAAEPLWECAPFPTQRSNPSPWSTVVAARSRGSAASALLLHLLLHSNPAHRVPIGLRRFELRATRACKIRV